MTNVKDTGIVRELDKFWRIVIPREILISKGLECGKKLEIYVEGKDIILSQVDKDSAVVRNIDNVGRFAIPREVLKTQGYTGPGDKVRFLSEGKKIIVRRQAS